MKGDEPTGKLGGRPLEQAWWPWVLAPAKVYRAPSPPSPRVQRAVTWAAVIFFAAMAWFGGWPIARSVVRVVQVARWIQHWPTTSATITQSATVRHDEGTKVRYLPVITFTYPDPDHPPNILQAQGFEVVPMPTPWQSACDAVVAHYPVGSTHPCYYNPDHPTDAILERRQMPRLGLLLALLALQLTVIAAAARITAYLARGQPQRRREFRGDDSYPLALSGISTAPDRGLVQGVVLIVGMNATALIMVVGINLLLVPWWCVGVSAATLAIQIVATLGGLWRLRRDLPRRPMVTVAAPAQPGGLLSAHWAIPSVYGPVRQVTVDIRCTTTGIGNRGERRSRTSFPSGELIAQFAITSATPGERSGTIAWPIPSHLRPSMEVDQFHLRWWFCLTIDDDRGRSTIYAFLFPITSMPMAAALVVA